MNKKKILQEVLELILVVLLALSIRFYVVSLFRVYGPSMCNTLNNVGGECQKQYGDIMLVDHFSMHFSDPKLLDVVVFKPQNSDNYLVKRVIGVPGDEIKIEDGFVFKKINGLYQKLEENYLNNDNLGRTFTVNFRTKVEYLVPEKHFFLLGDNRNQSSDARNCFSKVAGTFCDPDTNEPFVSIEQIAGKSKFVIYPFENIGAIN